jgi:uncharacterized tellurite resistance protein B-like protein
MNFNLNQKRAIWLMIRQLADIDGVFHENEREVISSIKETLNFTNNSHYNMSGGEIISILLTLDHKQRRQVIKMLLVVAKADGNVCAKEVEFIDMIANAIDVPPSEIFNLFTLLMIHDTMRILENEFNSGSLNN